MSPPTTSAANVCVWVRACVCVCVCVWVRKRDSLNERNLPLLQFLAPCHVTKQQQHQQQQQQQQRLARMKTASCTGTWHYLNISIFAKFFAKLKFLFKFVSSERIFKQTRLTFVWEKCMKNSKHRKYTVSLQEEV